jgi:hypothetical protein
VLYLVYLGRVVASAYLLLCTRNLSSRTATQQGDVIERRDKRAKMKGAIGKFRKVNWQSIMLSLTRTLRLLIFEPMCMTLSLFSAILSGVLYLFFDVFQIIFRNTYGTTRSQVGLSLMGMLIGTLIRVMTDL